MQDFQFKTAPYAHQKEAFVRGRGCRLFAYLMEQGTGKTKVLLDDAAFNFERKSIDALLVVAPNGVHENWSLREIPLHCACPSAVFVWRAGRLNTKKGQAAYRDMMESVGCLKIVCMNVDAFATEKGYQFAVSFMKQQRTMMVVDESTRIKTPAAKRTRAICNAGKYAVAKRIMTGTPISQGPLDMYSQVRFLSKDIFGFDSFSGFKAYFAVWAHEFGGTRGAGYDRLVEYRNLDEMSALLAPYAYRVEKKDCLDLPDKVYQTRLVYMNDEQASLYKALKEEFLLELDEALKVSLLHALSKMTRMRQVAGGFTADDDGMFKRPLGKTNPKVEAMLDILEQAQGKAIVWCSYKAEVAACADALRQKYGNTSVVEFHGDVGKDGRQAAIDAFQNEPCCRFFVATPQSGGTGLTLTAGETQIFFSNDFNSETRRQAEDRSHRIGTKKSVLYVDLVAKGTLDQYILEALQSKADIANYVLKRIKEGGETD